MQANEKEQSGSPWMAKTKQLQTKHNINLLSQRNLLFSGLASLETGSVGDFNHLIKQEIEMINDS